MQSNSVMATENYRPFENGKYNVRVNKLEETRQRFQRKGHCRGNTEKSTSSCDCQIANREKNYSNFLGVSEFIAESGFSDQRLCGALFWGER